MEIEVVKGPIPYLIIKNMFNDQQYQSVWDEIMYLSSRGALQGPESTHAAHETDENGNRIFKKRGDGRFITDFFKNPLESNIIRALGEVYTTNIGDVFAPYFEESPWLVTMRNINYSDVLLQRYKNDDYYSSHKDHGAYTMVTHMYKTPKMFTGGDFYLCEFGKNIKVEMNNNQTVVFLSAFYHAVEPVVLQSDKLEDGRYTISHFLSSRLA